MSKRKNKKVVPATKEDKCFKEYIGKIIEVFEGYTNRTIYLNVLIEGNIYQFEYSEYIHDDTTIDKFINLYNKNLNPFKSLKTNSWYDSVHLGLKNIYKFKVKEFYVEDILIKKL